MALTTYSPKKVFVNLNGIDIGGYADGTFVNVEYNADSFETVVGSDGEFARSANPDLSGTITITLMSTSASNDIISSLAAADRLSGLGTFPILVKDGNGTSLHTGAEAYVKKIANREFGRTVGTVEWQITVPELISFVGGNLG